MKTDNLKRRLTAVEKAHLDAFVDAYIEDAETAYSQLEDQIVELAEDTGFRKMAKALTQIPGHEILPDDVNVLDDFVVFTADMRHSTKHLMVAESRLKPGVTPLKRVFIETSVLLPTLAEIVSLGNGKVTEYLGDGVLAFYRVPDGQDSKVIGEAHRSAEKCLECVVDIVNPKLEALYGIPPMEIGIGLARSQAIIRLIGLKSHRVPRVFGKAVFYASKLSCGINEIYLDDNAHAMWPKVKDGEKPVVRFSKKRVRDHDGHKLDYLQSA